MRSLVAFVVSSALLFACAGPSAETPPPASEPAPKSGAGDLHGDEIGDPEHSTEPSKANNDAPPELPKAPPAADVGFDFHVWADDHQIEAALESDGCEPANLGAKPGDVIWCLHHVETKEGTVSYSRALYVARLKKLVKLVEIPYAVGPMDSDEPKSKDADRYLVKLVFERASDGKHVELKEAPDLDCAHADKQNEDNKTAAPVLYKAYLPAIKKVCAQRGNWEWTGATLVRRAH